MKILSAHSLPRLTLQLPRPRRLGLVVFATISVALLTYAAAFAYLYQLETNASRIWLENRVSRLNTVNLDLRAELDDTANINQLHTNTIAKQKQKISAQKRTIDKLTRTKTSLTNQVADLQLQLANNRIAETAPITPSAPAVSAPTGSIYQRISIAGPLRTDVIAAINLLESKDPQHFARLNTYVDKVYQFSNFCGGLQLKRNIYIHDCYLGIPATVTATLIVHEATHVYNVYVNGIYTSGTREQELPSYEAELVSAQRIGSPQYHIDSIKAGIAYWKSQP